MENGSAMTVEREFTFDDEAIHHRSLNAVATVLSTATWLSRSVNCILTYPFLKPPRAYAYEVSQEWIDEQKRLHVPTEHAPYISTNDILTSWFLRRGDYDVGYMVMDMRDRPSAMDKTRITSKHAGNYVSFLPMKKDIYSDPSGIRSILKQNMKDTYSSRDTPAFWNFLRGPRFGIVTTWTFCPTEIHLPGCVQMHQQPSFDTFSLREQDIFDMAYVYTRGTMIDPGQIIDLAVIFRPTPSTYGILMTDITGTQPSFEDDPAFKREIFPMSTM